VQYAVDLDKADVEDICVNFHRRMQRRRDDNAAGSAAWERPAEIRAAARGNDCWVQRCAKPRTCSAKKKVSARNISGSANN
jgi:hypothetical protein